MTTSFDDESGESNEPQLADITASIRRLSALMATIAGAEGEPAPGPDYPHERRSVRTSRSDAEARRAIIANLRLRLERAAQAKRRDEIDRIMQELGELAGSLDRPRLAAPPLPTVRAVAPRELSTGKILFLVANTILATATVTSIAWYLFQSTAVERNRSIAADPAARSREHEGWRARFPSETGTLKEEPKGEPGGSR